MTLHDAFVGRSSREGSRAEGVASPSTSGGQHLGWSLVRRGMVGFSLAGLLFGRQVTVLRLARQTYYHHWDRWDGVALVLDLLLFAGLFALIATLRSRRQSGVLRFALDLAFLLVLAEGFLAFFRPRSLGPGGPYRVFSGVVLLTLIVLVLVLRPGPRIRLISSARTLLLILSPLPIALVLFAFTLPDWGSPARRGLPGPSSQPPGGRPVFLLVFDEMSFERSTRNGRFLPYLTNLRALADQSLWFTHASSRSLRTETSLPAIIFQTDKEFVIQNSGTFWRSGSTSIPTANVPSLFQLAHDHGQSTALLGFYHPYSRMLQGQLDHCDVRTLSPKGDGLVNRMGILALDTTQTLTDPIVPVLGRLVRWRLQRRHWYDINGQTLRAVESWIDRSTPETFTIIHWPYPHAPFVFDEDGGFRSEGLVSTLRTYLRQEGEAFHDVFEGIPTDYDRALRQVDRFVGRVIAAIRSSGKYDDATIILTSDHSWRTDLLVKDNLRASSHIPLLIKMPHQTKGHAIDRPVLNYGIKDLIEGVLRGGLDAERAEHLIAMGRLLNSSHACPLGPWGERNSVAAEAPTAASRLGCSCHSSD